MLLNKYPNLRVIHLVRDPRAVALSRMKLFSSRGIYSGNDTIKEAKLYCRTVIRDINVIRTLDQSLSDRIMLVIYDKFVKNPVTFSENIYDFIGSRLPNITRDFMKGKTRDKTQEWQIKLSPENINGINTECAEFFKTIGSFSYDMDNDK